MALVCFGRLAHHTNGQLVFLAEQLELLSVLRAELPGLSGLPPSSTLHKGLAQVPQSQVGGRVAPGRAPAAHRASASGRGLPTALQTLPAEAVAARQQDGVPEEVTAHRA